MISKMLRIKRKLSNSLLLRTGEKTGLKYLIKFICKTGGTMEISRNLQKLMKTGYCVFMIKTKVKAIMNSVQSTLMISSKLLI